MFAHLIVTMALAFPGAGNKPVRPAAPEQPSKTQTTEKARVVPPVTSPAKPTPVNPVDRDLAQWLVDLARHQGHLVGRTDPRSASMHVLALLEAAVAVSPECTEAYYWLYDLYYRMGELGDAQKVLTQYVRLAPTDEAARLRLLQMELSDRQTAEDRTEYLKSRLKQTNLPKAYESELHYQLARHYYERRETEYAAAEVEQALRLNSMNVPARQLAYEMFGETEPALQRVEAALQLIAMNPTQANVVWDLAEFLDRLSLHAQAEEWYKRAIEIHINSTGKAAPAAYWQKLALSYLANGDYEKAKEAADETLKIEPGLHNVRLLRANAETKLNQADAAESDINYVAQAYEAAMAEVLEKKDAATTAEMAWFYCYHQPDKDRALKLAKLAMEVSEPSSLARLAYGYALRLNGRTDEALTVLEPLTNTDQLAALELAKAQIERGKKAQAITTLHKAATIQYSGVAYQLIRDLLTKYNENAPQPPLHTKIVAALDKFPRDIFHYYQSPQDYLKFTIRFTDQTLPATGPINVAFRLENVGPFPITFGEGFMTRPLVAVSARIIPVVADLPRDGQKTAASSPKVSGDTDVVQAASSSESSTTDSSALADTATPFDSYLQVLMNSRTILPPGETIEKTVAVDVGPIHEHLLSGITQAVDIELRAMFDPVYEDGRLTAGLGTIRTEPIIARRPALDISPTGLAAILEQAGSAEAPKRAAAADILGAVRATAAAHATDENLQDLPLDAVNTAMASLLADADWRVRARATVAAGWTKLDPRITNAAAGGVRSDAHPVVKLLAIRLFAQHHGEKFVQVLQQFSRVDPSPFVRMMAESFLPRRPNVTANHSPGSDEAAIP